jgi:plastocyanin
MLAAAGAVVMLAACSGAGPTVNVTANNVDDDKTTFRFTPGDVTIPQGGTISLKNTGDVEHNLTVDGQSIVIYTGVGQTAQSAINLPPGSYTFQCTIVEGGATHGSLGMKGTLTVTAKP